MLERLHDFLSDLFFGATMLAPIGDGFKFTDARGNTFVCFYDEKGFLVGTYRYY